MTRKVFFRPFLNKWKKIIKFSMKTFSIIHKWGKFCSKMQMWCRLQCWIVHQASAFFLKVFFALMKSPGIDFEKKKKSSFFIMHISISVFYILRYELLYKFVLQKFLQGVQYGKMPLEIIINNYCYSNIALYIVLAF